MFKLYAKLSVIKNSPFEQFACILRQLKMYTLHVFLFFGSKEAGAVFNTGKMMTQAT